LLQGRCQVKSVDKKEVMLKFLKRREKERKKVSNMAFKHFRKINILLAFTLVSFLGCAPLVKTNIDSYLKNQEDYKGKKIVFTAELEDILKRYELYKNKEIELTAPLAYFGERRFWTWYLILEKDGKKIRCYETKYRLYPGRNALLLLSQARSKGGEVTVRGRLKYDGIELDRLIYKGYVVNTNDRPYRYGYY